jgi:hypothetical protein
MKYESMDAVLRQILTKMCDYVGADVETIDTTQQGWFRKYSWTEEQENDFKLWLCNKLRNNRTWRNYLLSQPNKSGQDYLKRCVDSFVFNYGWTIKGMKR